MTTTTFEEVFNKAIRVPGNRIVPTEEEHEAIYDFMKEQEDVILEDLHSEYMYYIMEFQEDFQETITMCIENLHLEFTKKIAKLTKDLANLRNDL